MANERHYHGRVKKLKGASVAMAVALSIGFSTSLLAQSRRTPQHPHSAVRAKTRPAAQRLRTGVLEVGKRDPFRLPPPPRPGSEGGVVQGPLPPGKRGLVIGQLKLEGIVREDKTNNMIAVVTNATNRAYFLRVNDQVYNGVVSKITPDSVYFTENHLENSGRLATREVVKKLGSAPGEGR